MLHNPALATSFLAAGFFAPTVTDHLPYDETCGRLPWPDPRIVPTQNSFAISDVPVIMKDTFSSIYGRTKDGVTRELNSEGGRAVLYITAANFAVYILWKRAPSAFMFRYE